MHPIATSLMRKIGTNLRVDGCNCLPATAAFADEYDAEAALVGGASSVYMRRRVDRHGVRRCLASPDERDLSAVCQPPKAPAEQRAGVVSGRKMCTRLTRRRDSGSGQSPMSSAVR